MDITHKPTSAAAGVARYFPAELAMTTLFDCPLWPAADLDPNVLVNFMTGLNRPTHTSFAHMLCRQSLAQQLPKLVERYGAHLEVATLQRQLAFHAEVRSGELSQWLDKLAETAQIDISSVPKTSELLYEWADELDWFLCAQPNRPAALRLWFRRLTRSKITALANTPRLILDASLPELDAMYLHHVEQARHKHGIWLQTRRCVADVPEHVKVEPLDANTYTAEQWDSEHSEPSKGWSPKRFTCGRLDYFRTQSKFPPAIN